VSPRSAFLIQGARLNILRSIGNKQHIQGHKLFKGAWVIRGNMVHMCKFGINFD